mmetsp:Transcript_20531/g.56922  ORF Transcript_20531/g.56922 Transcript_20531/m.56922 type:complete len:313 (+) Transcript_20531:645-1583(+)
MASFEGLAEERQLCLHPTLEHTLTVPYGSGLEGEVLAVRALFVVPPPVNAVVEHAAVVLHQLLGIELREQSQGWAPLQRDEGLLHLLVVELSPLVVRQQPPIPVWAAAVAAPHWSGIATCQMDDRQLIVWLDVTNLWVSGLGMEGRRRSVWRPYWVGLPCVLLLDACEVCPVVLQPVAVLLEKALVRLSVVGVCLAPGALGALVLAMFDPDVGVDFEVVILASLSVLVAVLRVRAGVVFLEASHIATDIRKLLAVLAQLAGLFESVVGECAALALLLALLGTLLDVMYVFQAVVVRVFPVGAGLGIEDEVVA